MSTKGSSMGFHVSLVDHVFVVPVLGGYALGSTMLVYPSYVGPFP